MKQTISLLFFTFFIISSFSQQKVLVAERPNWINYQSYNDNPDVDKDEISQGSLTLLADYQVNIPREEAYYRVTTKITDNAGIQSASDINVSYDPLYQKLTFHSISIIRGDETINKLNADHFQVIRRELNAENHLYDGSLSAMLNLSDVRHGDIIDCSYTIKGFNPIHEGRFSNIYYMNDYVPIGKVNISINSRNTLNYKTYNTDLKPTQTTHDGLKRYEWTTINPDKTVYEAYTPQWKLTLPTIAISDYKSWSEVVKWGIDLYNINTNLNQDLISKIKTIDDSSNKQGDKIRAVLDFVQNDVRYLGLEYGIGSYKPNSPNKVFKQRYGDCKDKSLLMVKMLNKMNIEAYPMFVNTTLKQTIIELLPSPIFFDHCVVKVIDGAGNQFYYDPTLFNQGGNFANVHFPNYEYGLVIKKGNTEFDTIASSSSNKITTNEEFILEEDTKGATLNITTVYTDVEADNIRNYFKNNSLSGIVKEYENYYANLYPKIKTLEQPTISDNIDTNEFTVFESYKIDSIWTAMPMKEGYVSIDFSPTSLADVLQIPNIETRNNEIELPFPVSRQHNTKIKLPSAWSINNENDLISNNTFYYDWDVKYNRLKKEITLKSFLKTQKSHVALEDLKTYFKDITKLENTFSFTIYVPEDGNAFPLSTDIDGSTFLAIGKLIFYVVLAVAIFLVVFWLSTKNKGH